MIGRKLPYRAGKTKSSDEDTDWDSDRDDLSFLNDREIKKSIRRARRVKRARRLRKARNGWMFGRKIRVSERLYPPKWIPSAGVREETVVVTDANGVECTYHITVCGKYRLPPPKVVKEPDPSYDDVFKFFGDIADYDICDVTFTYQNVPGAIPIDEKLYFIPPTTK